MKMPLYLWVDDERHAPDKQPERGVDYTEVANYRDAILAIDAATGKTKIYIDLDHDLGEVKTGYDIAKYIVMNQVPNVYWRCHSMNSVGRMNIVALLNHYGYPEW